MAYILSYRRQLESLELNEGDGWRLCILEGDSRDSTWEYLVQWASEDSRVTIGRECVGDTAEIEDRAARWAKAGNACFNMILSELQYSHVLWLESDLCFPPEFLKRLLAHNVDIVAPIIWLGGLFYDSWGFRDLNGKRWTGTAPYHPDYRPMSLMEMGSVGSCVLFRREILDTGIRFKGTYENGLLVGLCHDARALGFKVFADTSTAIIHPSDNWEAQMWRPSQIVITNAEGSSSTMSLDNARSLGLQMNLPFLDPAVMLSANRRFWKNLYRSYQTNRLQITVSAKVFPRKQYHVNVHIEPPDLLCRIPIVRHLFLLSWRLKIVQKAFRCAISIVIDN